MPPNYIPNLLREFFKTNKDKKINIESYAAATSVILRDLKEDKIDFGFCSIGKIRSGYQNDYTDGISDQACCESKRCTGQDETVASRGSYE